MLYKVLLYKKIEENSKIDKKLKLENELDDEFLKFNQLTDLVSWPCVQVMKIRETNKNYFRQMTKEYDGKSFRNHSW